MADFEAHLEFVPMEIIERIATLCGEASSKPLQGGVVLLLSLEGQPCVFGFAHMQQGQYHDIPYPTAMEVLREFVDKEREAPSFPPLSDPDGGRRGD